MSTRHKLIQAIIKSDLRNLGTTDQNSAKRKETAYNIGVKLKQHLKEKDLDLNMNLFKQRCDKFYNQYMTGLSDKICININKKEIEPNKYSLIIKYHDEFSKEKKKEIDWEVTPFSNLKDLKNNVFFKRIEFRDPKFVIEVLKKPFLEYLNIMAYCLLKEKINKYDNNLSSEDIITENNKLGKRKEQFESWFKDNSCSIPDNEKCSQNLHPIQPDKEIGQSDQETGEKQKTNKDLFYNLVTKIDNWIGAVNRSEHDLPLQKNYSGDYTIHHDLRNANQCYFEVLKIKRLLDRFKKEFPKLYKDAFTIIGNPEPDQETTPEEEKQPIKKITLPENTNWNEIILVFKDDDTVEVQYDNKDYGVYHFSDLGLNDKRSKKYLKPCRLWDLLQDFAKYSGTISHSNNTGHNWGKDDYSRLNIKMNKKFNIGNPFLQYDKKMHHYKLNVKNIIDNRPTNEPESISDYYS